MTAEQNELYNFTINQYKDRISRISKDCISPIISARQVVKDAITKYHKDYCSKCANIFAQEDFTVVSNKICDEIMSR